MEPSPNVFTCQMCGECCLGQGGIVVTGRDVARLSHCLDMSRQAFQERYCQPSGNGKIALCCNDLGYCIFFQPEAGCSVHTHKPDICSAWPFFRGNLEDAASLEMAKEFCPGIGRHVGHREFVRQGLAYLREKDLLRTNDPEAPNALCIDSSRLPESS